VLYCFRGYGILRAIGRSGPENKLWFSIDGPGGFLLSPGGLGYKSAGPCHLYFNVTLEMNLHSLC